MSSVREQIYQERLDKADPFLVEHLLTQTDEQIAALMEKKQTELQSPLLVHSHSTREAIKDHLMIAECVIALRMIRKMRAKELAANNSDAENLGISIV